MNAKKTRRTDWPTSAQMGAVLKKTREDKGRTVEGIAAAARIDAFVLERIEAGRTEPTLGCLHRIADALEVSLVTLASVATNVTPAAPEVPPHTLTHVASAILSLPVKGSKVQAAIEATVVEALRRTEGNQSAAARLLGMERKAFTRRLAKAS